MSLHTKTILLITGFLLGVMGLTTALLGWTSRQLLVQQAEDNGKLIAQFLAMSARFADQIPNDVEQAIGEQMVIEATLTAHLVDVAENGGVSMSALTKRLERIVADTALDEIWVTDEKGHAYLHSMPGVDFTFDSDPAKQPQASHFWPLLTGKSLNVIQDARKREIDDKTFKYVGVRGIDKPRIVQVGYDASFLNNLRRMVGIERLINEVLKSSEVKAVSILNHDGQAVYTTQKEAYGEIEPSLLRDVLSTGKSASYLHGGDLVVFTPMGEGMGIVVVNLSMDAVRELLKTGTVRSLGLVFFLLLIGLAAAFMVERRIINPIIEVTNAAASAEEGVYDTSGLARLTARKDEIGRLAQVFRQMILEVQEREARMKAEIRKLTIEIDDKKKKEEVSAITESDYFQDLQRRISEMRGEYEDPKA